MQLLKRSELLIERQGLLFEQGMEHEKLYTVLDGVMLRYRELEDGRRQIVNFMFPGALVGLQSSFAEPANHSIVALVDTRLCVFEKMSFFDMITQHPELCYDVIWLSAKEETALEEHLMSLGQRSAKERVTYLAVWLLDEAKVTGMARPDNIVELPIRQAQIADMLGLSLVHTNRTLKALAREGILEWTPRRIHIPDMDRAMEFAHFSTRRKAPRPFL